ncbi:unnamed protein product, partial [Vitis vinifera]|uniref:Uncharacterized protein n=1 Tax=Vitis vinifera TaxID=29760 RepID=D7SVN9_VITVI
MYGIMEKLSTNFQKLFLIKTLMCNAQSLTTDNDQLFMTCNSCLSCAKCITVPFIVSSCPSVCLLGYKSRPGTIPLGWIARVRLYGWPLALVPTSLLCRYSGSSCQRCCSPGWRPLIQCRIGLS